MKRKRQIIVLLAIVFFFVFVADAYPLDSAKIVDMSSITLPYYPLPKGYITKKQAIEIAVKAAEWRLHKGEKPRNIQCLLLPYDVGSRILDDISSVSKKQFKSLEKGRLSKEELNKYMSKYYERDSRLMYFIIMDVNRYPGEALICLPPDPGFKPHLINGKYLTTQDTYVIDAQTGEITGHGYYGIIKHIYPKQRQSP